ncbi:MAG: AAC(3) family N-acetyltransferase [Spirochaetales bacterium]|nr:AAC(3) family N-acetyltransferase [Spirochaetales bacterium]
MPEKDTIDFTLLSPVTREGVANDLRSLGVLSGGVLVVHSSLSSIGWVVGGAQGIIEGLLQVLGPDGTLVMPTHTGHLCDPAHWENPPVPESWWSTIRSEMPTFDPARTRTWGMGTIPELFRTFPGVLRSVHPWDSFAAYGPRAGEILQDQKLDFPLDDQSPLGRLYEAGAQVLLLGVGYDSCTCFHLAEYRANWPGKEVKACHAPVAQPFFAQRTWAEFKDIEYAQDDFPQIGQALEDLDKVFRGKVGKADSRVFSIVDGVDFATRWIETNR